MRFLDLDELGLGVMGRDIVWEYGGVIRGSEFGFYLFVLLINISQVDASKKDGRWKIQEHGAWRFGWVIWSLWDSRKR